MTVEQLVVGDRVKCIEDNYHKKSRAGKTGKVVLIENNQYNSDYICVLVEFDEHINGHDGLEAGNSIGKDGHCWWFDERIYRPMKHLMLISSITIDEQEMEKFL